MSSSTLRLHVVALKACGLGVVGTLALVCLAANYKNQGVLPRICLYILATCIFHFLEFLTTALYNTAETDDDSFILTDTDLHVVYVVSAVETAAQYWFFGSLKWALYLGLAVVLGGQCCRTLAMYTAGVSFNHYVQQTRQEKHKLVTSGIYKYLRHPSYFGFFWWFVGTQIMLQNWVMLLAGGYKLHSFFKSRIDYEEEFLLSFFTDYSDYRKRTNVWIPGIV